MSYTATQEPGKIVSLLACFDDGMIVVYDVCQHHMTETRKAETERFRDERSRALTIEGALFPELKHWLFFSPQQGAQVCSVCFQLEKGNPEPKPMSRVAAAVKDH